MNDEICGSCGALRPIDPKAAVNSCPTCGDRVVGASTPAVEDINNLCRSCRHMIAPDHDEIGCMAEGCVCTVNGATALDSIKDALSNTKAWREKKNAFENDPDRYIYWNPERTRGSHDSAVADVMQQTGCSKSDAERALRDRDKTRQAFDANEARYNVADDASAEKKNENAGDLNTLTHVLDGKCAQCNAAYAKMSMNPGDYCPVGAKALIKPNSSEDGIAQSTIGRHGDFKNGTPKYKVFGDGKFIGDFEATSEDEAIAMGERAVAGKRDVKDFRADLEMDNAENQNGIASCAGCGVQFEAGKEKFQHGRPEGEFCPACVKAGKDKPPAENTIRPIQEAFEAHVANCNACSAEYANAQPDPAKLCADGMGLLTAKANENGYTTNEKMVMRENVTCPKCGDRGRLFVSEKTGICDACMNEAYQNENSVKYMPERWIGLCRSWVEDLPENLKKEVKRNTVGDIASFSSQPESIKAEFKKYIEYEGLENAGPSEKCPKCGHMSGFHVPAGMQSSSGTTGCTRGGHKEGRCGCELTREQAAGEKENAGPTCSCGHADSDHIERNQSCTKCDCSKYAEKQNARPMRCSCGGTVEAVAGEDDRFECDECGQLYEKDDWRSGRLKAIENADPKADQAASIKAKIASFGSAGRLSVYIDGAWKNMSAEEAARLDPMRVSDVAAAQADNAGEFTVSVDGGAPIRIAEFLAANADLAPEDKAAVQALQPGRKLTLGGGAGAEAVVERTNADAARVCESMTCASKKIPAAFKATMRGGKEGYFCSGHEQSLERKKADGDVLSIERLNAVENAAPHPIGSIKTINDPKGGYHGQKVKVLSDLGSHGDHLVTFMNPDGSDMAGGQIRMRPENLNTWKCLECGRKFASAAAAEKATFSDRGCPGCGGSDIDDVVENQNAPQICKCGHRLLNHAMEGNKNGKCDDCDCKQYDGAAQPRPENANSAFCPNCEHEKNEHDTNGKCTLCDCLTCYEKKNAVVVGDYKGYHIEQTSADKFKISKNGDELTELIAHDLAEVHQRIDAWIGGESENANAENPRKAVLLKKIKEGSCTQAELSEYHAIYAEHENINVAPPTAADREALGAARYGGGRQ